MNAFEVIVSPLGRLLRNKRAGEQHSVRVAPQLATDRTIELTTPAFEPGGHIPDRHASMDRGPNISPELAWGPVPDGTRQLLLVIEDIDVPMSRPGLHTIALLPADLRGLDEGVLVKDNPTVRYVPGVRGRTGYLGPRPLPGHGVHHYGFHLYALDVAIPADTAIANMDALLPLVDGHVLAAGFIEGIQEG